jgi:hypothetical protein
MAETILDREADHPQTVVAESGRGRILAMDSARFIDGRNTGRDVCIPASYLGVMPARLLAPARPRAVIGHDACIGKDAAGIAGLPYLEALGIPAATADGMSAELGNGVDLYESGVISRLNDLAYQCGVRMGMPVREAATLLLENDPTDTEPGNKIRYEVAEEHESGRQVVVTDSIVFARDEDRGKNVLVTAGHTGRSGASFIAEVHPWGFICSDGGRSKNDSGIAGLPTADEAGIAGASADAHTAPIGDAFAAYREGLIGAVNERARARGVREGMPVAEAAHLLLQDDPS